MKSFTKQSLTALGLGALSFFGMMPTAHAASNPAALEPTAAGSKDINLDANYFQTLGGKIVTIMLAIAGALAVIYLIWNGIQYITAGGDDKKVEAARKGIINAVIGIIVIVASYFIVRIASGLVTTAGSVL